MFTGRMTQIVLPVVLAALVFGLWTSPPALAGEEKPKAPAVGDKAADFTLPIFADGSKFKLYDALG